MKTNIKTSAFSIMIIVITAMLMTTVIGADDIYAASKTGKVKSYKKAIKSYNSKTQKLAKVTTSAKKYAKKTSGYYKKAKKTKSVKKLKKLRSKAKSSYTKAQCLDYKRQVNDVYKDIKKISDKAPSMDTYVSQALTTNNKAKKSNSISTLKSYLTSINSLHKTAKTHKSTLTWRDPEYDYEYVKGHYKTEIVQKAEYVYGYVSYYKAVAESKGFQTGEHYNWDLATCITNDSIFPLYEGKDALSEWGVIACPDGNGNRIRPITDTTAYEKTYLLPYGISTQSIGTGEWFQTKEEITQEKWIDPYYKTTLVTQAGWY